MFRLAIAAAALLLAVPAAAQAPAFRTDGAATATLAVTATSGRVQIQTASPGAPNARIFNAGASIVFVECGGVAVVATVAASMPVAAGTVEVIGCQTSHLAAVTSTGTSTLYVTPGTGL